VYIDAFCRKVFSLKFDLHLHTTASDGTDTPTQLLERAAQGGFEVLAITDHDTLSGLEEARAAAQRLGIRLIPGVEISAGQHVDVHVLGYGMTDCSGMEQTLRRMRKARQQRMQDMIAKLRQIGIEVDAERVRQLSGESVGRSHLARVLLEMGKVHDVREAFYRYLSPGRPAYVPREKLSVAQAIRLIRDCGGLPVIAHPGQNRGDTFWLAERVAEMQKEGLMGLEVYHMAHSKTQCQTFERIARRLDLLVTGGSDYHGAIKKVGIGDGMQYWHSRQQDLELFLQKLP